MAFLIRHLRYFRLATFCDQHKLGLCLVKRAFSLPSTIPFSHSRLGIRLSGCLLLWGTQAGSCLSPGRFISIKFCIVELRLHKNWLHTIHVKISADISVYKLYGKAFNYLLQCMHEFIPLNHPIMATLTPCCILDALSPAGTLSLSLDRHKWPQFTQTHTHSYTQPTENHEDISPGHQGGCSCL